jgi:hypothetical protein
VEMLNWTYEAWTMDASILHLKSGGSGRSSYFLTSTLSKRIPHHHEWSPPRDRLVRHRDFDI